MLSSDPQKQEPFTVLKYRRKRISSERLRIGRFQSRGTFIIDTWDVDPEEKSEMNLEFSRRILEISFICANEVPIVITIWVEI